MFPAGKLLTQTAQRCVSDSSSNGYKAHVYSQGQISQDKKILYIWKYNSQSSYHLCIRKHTMSAQTELKPIHWNKHYIQVHL